MGRDSSVGIATRYGLDGPGIESQWGARFSASVQTGPGAHPASYTVGTGSFPRVKRQGRSVDHLPPSSAEVEGRVELYICSSFGVSWPVLGRTLPFTFIIYCPDGTEAVPARTSCEDRLKARSSGGKRRRKGGGKLSIWAEFSVRQAT